MSYNISDLNSLFKHITLMDGKEINNEMFILNSMGKELNVFIEPETTDCSKVESSINSIVSTYIDKKLGDANAELKKLAMDHKTFIFSIILANTCICSIMIDAIEKFEKNKPSK